MSAHNDPFLSDEAMVRFTGRRWKSLQIAYLKTHGVPFTVTAMGHPRVTVSTVEARQAVQERTESRWTPRVISNGV